MTLSECFSLEERQVSERIQYEEYGEDAQKQSLPVFSKKKGWGVVLRQSYNEPLEVGVDIGEKQMGKLVEASEYRKHIYPRKILTENSLKL